jgi:hypothetical protein
MGVHVAGTQRGLAYHLAPLEGTRAPALIALKSRAPAARVEFWPLQRLIWQIQAGLSYNDMSPESRALVDQLIPEYRNQLRENFVQSLQRACGWGGILRKLSGGVCNDINAMMARYHQTQQTLQKYANNYEALAQQIVHVIPGTYPNAGPTSWSQLNPRVYARVTGGHVWQETGNLEVRVIPRSGGPNAVASRRGDSLLRNVSYGLTGSAHPEPSADSDAADVPLEAAMAYPNNAAGMQGLTVEPEGGGSAPIITSVTPVLPQAKQIFVIEGSGFGTQAAYNGNWPYVEITDLTRNWSAGKGLDLVGLNIPLWTDTQIWIEGFARLQWPVVGQSLRGNDKLSVKVYNAQANSESAPYPATVQLVEVAPQVVKDSKGSYGVQVAFIPNANNDEFIFFTEQEADDLASQVMSQLEKSGVYYPARATGNASGKSFAFFSEPVGTYDSQAAQDLSATSKLIELPNVLSDLAANVQDLGKLLGVGYSVGTWIVNQHIPSPPDIAVAGVDTALDNALNAPELDLLCLRPSVYPPACTFSYLPLANSYLAYAIGQSLHQQELLLVIPGVSEPTSQINLSLSEPFWYYPGSTLDLTGAIQQHQSANGPNLTAFLMRGNLTASVYITRDVFSKGVVPPSKAGDSTRRFQGGDATIVSNINARLWQDSTLKTQDIRVSSQNGTVKLEGTVATVAQKKRAEQIAQTEKGVKLIIDRLGVGAASGSGPH